MRVKTYEAVDMKQALGLVRADLGPNAVIVSSRSVRRDSGMFGMLGRKVLEVTAAVEEPTRPEPPEPGGNPRAPEDGDTARRRRGGTGAYRDIWAVRQAVDPLMDEVRDIRESVAALNARMEGESAQDMRSDLAQIRTLLGTLVGGGMRDEVEGAAAQRLFYFLLGRGIDDPLARSLVQRVVARVETGSLGDLERLKLNLAAEMRADLSRVQRGGVPSRVQVFVGPTGVGKTTTIAKLAARAQRNQPGSVLVITTDVQRVAAVEQMTRFGEILGVPVDVALNPDALSRRIQAHESPDMILVDTPGRSHRNAHELRALSPFIEAAGECETLLVMSATTRAVDSRELLEAYDCLPWSRLIMTKLDETRVYGELYNATVRSSRPIACVTTGQAVPDHLESLDVTGILRKVLHG